MRPKCLLIEDDSALCELWTRYLTDAGIDVEARMRISDGMEAMRKIPPPDIVILDLRLPDSPSDVGTLGYIRALKQIHPDAIVIVATGYSTPQIQDLAMKLGADAFADKCTMGTQEGCWSVLKGFLEKHKGTGQRGAEATIELIERLSQPIPGGRNGGPAKN